ncbi:ATP-binding protein [Streptomyces sp. ODS28]|uniref:ATP-binding protein n=1 Tax=Streptomyces sp. ODS28 TaxID=3136688 RepID=UPI0031EC34FF
MSLPETLDQHAGEKRTETCTAYLRSSAQARQIAEGYLSVLSPRPAPETVDMVMLVVSELVTNALQHAGGVTDFALGSSRGVLHITVSDPSTRLPRERTPDLTGSDTKPAGGFGWPLIRHFASELSLHLGRRGGKTIRATLAL